MRSERCARCWPSGCTVEGGVRLRTLVDVVAHLGASGEFGLLDATEVRVRRPAAHKAGRTRFVSGKARSNTAKALIITDAEGRLLCCGQTRPGAIHDLTRVRQAGLVQLPALIPGVPLLADAGYQGLSAQTAGAVISSHSSLVTRAGLAEHPCIEQVFIPKGACWLNLQEAWWRILRRHALAGQTFADPGEITQAPDLATAQLNAHAMPWVWGRPPPPPRPRRRRFTYLL